MLTFLFTAVAGQIQECLSQYSPQIQTLTHENTTLWDFNRLGSLRIVDLQPTIIVQAATVQDVQSAIKCGNQFNLTVVARGGGHSFMGYSSTQGGILLSLKPMNKMISFDGQQGIASFGAGATLGQVYQSINQAGQGDWLFGAGTCPSVGLVGHTICVGFGPYGRQTGMSMDQVLSYEFVDAKGQIGVASNTQNQELFNTLKGGCFSPVIITKATLKLTPVTRRITYISKTILAGNVSAANDLIFKTMEWAAHKAPEKLTTVLELGDGGKAMFEANYMGPLSEAKKELGYLDTLGIDFEYQELDYIQVASKWARFPPNAEWSDLKPVSERKRRVCKSGFLDAPFTLGNLEILQGMLNQVVSTQLKVLGGRTAKNQGGIYMGRNATALYHHCTYFDQDNERSLTQAKLDAFQKKWETLNLDRGPFQSYPDQRPNWQELMYGVENYQKILAIKKQWDPAGRFSAFKLEK